MLVSHFQISDSRGWKSFNINTKTLRHDARSIDFKKSTKNSKIHVKFVKAGNVAPERGGEESQFVCIH